MKIRRVKAELLYVVGQTDMTS